MKDRHFPWTYWAYGLHIVSDIEVIGFLDASLGMSGIDELKPDVRIEQQRDVTPEDLLPAEILQQSMAVRPQQENSLELFVRNIALFRITAGQHVQVIPSSQASPVQINLALTGVVMAALLFQRQHFILHGSAIAMGTQAVLFLGDSGAGKSSLALAFHQKGFPVLTDDLASLRCHGGVCQLDPALPQIRTTEETARALNLDWSQLHQMPGLEKRYLNYSSTFDPQARRIAKIYIVQQSDSEISLEKIPGQQAMQELMHHSEVMHLFSQDPAQHFLACAQVLKTVPLYNLRRPKDWGQLDAVVAAIQDHLSTSDMEMTDRQIVTGKER